MDKITFIPGGGIKPEITEAAKRCIESVGVKIGWICQEAGVDGRYCYCKSQNQEV